MLGMFAGQQEGQCGWNEVSKEKCNCSHSLSNPSSTPLSGKCQDLLKFWELLAMKHYCNNG